MMEFFLCSVFNLLVSLISVSSKSGDFAQRENLIGTSNMLATARGSLPPVNKIFR